MARKSSVDLQIVESEHSTKNSKIKTGTHNLRIKIDDLKTFDPLTENQKIFFDAYKRQDYFIALHGVAGTGKTFCALYKALEEVLDRNNPFQKIIVVRSAVQSREIGHLPGDVHEKMEIYQQPYRQICETLKKKNDVSGILKFFDIAYHMAAFTRVEFTVEDIVRSSLVKDYIIAKLKVEDLNN